MIRELMLNSTWGPYSTVLDPIIILILILVTIFIELVVVSIAIHNVRCPMMFERHKEKLEERIFIAIIFGNILSGLIGLFVYAFWINLM